MSDTPRSLNDKIYAAWSTIDSLRWRRRVPAEVRTALEAAQARDREQVTEIAELQRENLDLRIQLLEYFTREQEAHLEQIRMLGT